MVLHRLEWSQEGHRYRADVREVEGRRVWFVGVDDELPREAFEQSDSSDENEEDLRRRLVQAVRLTDLE
jgi:hypothetical protein